MSKKNKIYLVTGSSSGIGLSVVKLLLKKQFTIIGVSRSKVKINNKKYFHLQLDISNRQNDIQIYEFLKKKNFFLDGIINNAGINIPNKFNNIIKKDYDLVLKTNLEAPFFIVQKLIGLIKLGGSIVNISSFSSLSGGPYSSHYAISKSGIEALTKNLAIFFKEKKIRVNAISPGLIKTRLAKGFKKHPYFERIILKRIGLPSEIASVVYFLLSNNSSYINGQIINVDGGMFFRQ